MPIPLEFCEVWFSFAVTGDNEPMYSHLAYGVGATITNAAVDAGFAEWQLQAKAQWNNTMTLTGGHVLQQTAAGIRRWDAGVAGVVGTGAGSLLPNNCAFLIKKSTALGGRRNRGRMYLPCPPEASVDAAGIVTGAQITSMNAVVARLLSGGSIHTAFGFLANPVVLHETGSQTPATITDLTTQAKIATQRRRMRR